MGKEDVVFINNGLLLSHRKDEILPFVAIQMDLEGIIPSGISQMEKNKNRDVTHMQNIKQKSNQRTNKTKINSQIQTTEWWLPKGKGFVGVGRG